MNRYGKRFLAALAVLSLLGAAGCGGGGVAGDMSVPPPPGSQPTRLTWDPPTTFIDSTPLDPYVDLDHYEFYVRPDPNFTDNDLHIAEVNAVDNQLLVSEFNLDNLLPFVPPGTRSYLSIRAVGVDGSKSPFSQPIAWDHT
ncbi:MAG: hypothetical protein Kow00128_12260 [Deltaproteobacteria bacterium]